MSLGRSATATPCLAAASARGGALAQPATQVEVIEVVGATPLGGELDTDRIAANVQTASAAELREQGALDLADFMKRSLGSVFVNEAQSNPLQPDVQYRGFVGSPLLGLPQGLAVYQDGVRINEPFGDTVNWALIPESAIDSVYLVPGSNPLFGLNALGGAIAVRTKDGFDHAGTRAELHGGLVRPRRRCRPRPAARSATSSATSSRRRTSKRTAGATSRRPRRSSSSASSRRSASGSRSTSSLTRVDTDLIGNGAAPEDLLELDREAIFTRPDRTENTLTMLSVSGEQTVSPNVTLRGNLYVRASDIDTLNGDDSDFEECEDTPGFICEEEGDDEELALDENDEPIPADDDARGRHRQSHATRSRTAPASRLQADFTGDARAAATIASRSASAHDEADVEFGASTELGALDETRQAVPGGVFVGEAFTGLETSTDEHGLLPEQHVHARRAHGADRVGPLQPHARRARGSARRRPRRRPHVPALQSRRRPHGRHATR